MKVTYLGTAMLALEHEGTRLLTDPALDPAGTTYDLGPGYTPRGWFETEKQYATPALPDGVFHGVLLSHDHHADNLDRAGRALVGDRARVERVLTTVPGAKRLGRATGLAPGETARIGNVTVRATPALHGPRFLPQTSEVVGFVLDVDHGPRIWISGDTVLHPALASTLEGLRAERPVDVAIVHCGAVAFPRMPLLGRARFTFDAAEAREACRILEPRLVVPIHRAGWAHFREPEEQVFACFADVAHRRLALGETMTL